MNKKSSKKKKTNNTKNILKIACIVLGVVAVIAVVYLIYILTAPKPSGIEDTYWKSVSAYDASDDEVEMAEVYDNYYSSYQGSMYFDADMTFEFWMSPGNPEDGTHTGEYTYDAESDKINAVFDSGEKSVFTIIRNEDNSIERIEVPYGDYTVWFVSKY